MTKLFKVAWGCQPGGVNGKAASHNRPASAWPADSGQGLVTRYDIKEFLINRLLANAVQLEVQVFQGSVNVLLRSLHRRQAAGIFAGKRLGTYLKQQDE